MITISQLRKDLFRLVESAAQGNVVEFSHKGMRFRLVPESAPSKLSRLTPWGDADQQDSGNQQDFLKANQEMTDQIMRDWDKKWADRMDK